MGIPLAPQRERVYVPELDGEYGRGTVYYSSTQNAFFSAGYETTHGPLAFDEVSGRVRWYSTPTGKVVYRDESGRFVSPGSFVVAFGARHFRAGVNLSQETILTDPTELTPSAQQQFVEYLYIRLPDKTVAIRTVEHGLGNPYSVTATGQQWFKKIAQSYDDPRWRDRIRKGKYTTRELNQFLVGREVVLQTNLGARKEPGRVR